MKKILLIFVVLLNMLQLNAQHFSSDQRPQPQPSRPPYNYTEGECFCYFVHDFTQFYTFIETLEQSIRNDWFLQQANIIKEEIEDRLNEDFDNLLEAQQAFFKQYSADQFENYTLNHLRQQALNNRNATLPLYEETFTERKIFQFAQNNSMWDFGGLRHQNSLIESLTYSEAQNLWNQYATENVIFKNNWETHHNRYLRIPWVNQNDLFSNYLVNQYVNHVNGHSLEDIVALMTGYLILDANHEPLILPPPYLQYPPWDNVFFYNPSLYNYNPVIDNYIDNANVPWEPITEPSQDFNEIKVKYSVLEGHLGTLVANFLKDKIELKLEVGAYMAYHNYDASSRALIKNLFESYLLEDPFMNDSFWWGNGKWGQSSDTPWKLAGLNWSQNAINNQSAFGFSRVLEAFSQANIGLAYEGALIHKMLTINNSAALNNLNHLTFEELGRLFDFKHYGNTQLWLTFSPYALSRILNIEDGNNNYDWHLFWDTGFKLEALRAILEGGLVDFEEKLIIDTTVSTCVQNIITPLINKSTYISVVPNLPININLTSIILNLFNNSSNHNLLIEVKNLGNNVNASTIPSYQGGGVFLYTITLNSSYVNNATDLAIARTIIHESVHAYLSYIYQTQPFSDISTILRYHLTQQGITTSQAQHLYMVQFVDAIAYSLQNWDNNSLGSLDYYRYLAWSGDMLNTPDFNQLPLIFQQNVIDANIAEGQAGPGNGSTNIAKGQNNCQ